MTSTLIVGAGPAGLTAAYELGRLGLPATVLERDQTVGGIARTVEYRGYRFDIGGHRFFSKVGEVEAIWHDLLGEDLLERPRLSRIHYRGKFFDYPLKPLNALRGLGPIETVRILASYAKARLRPNAPEDTFDQWVTKRFGRRLFEIFFETYTEKVWGMPCTEIDATWAAQRIKNLDLVTAVRNAVFGSGRDGEIVTTLIERFWYPRLGPGMMWERCVERIAEQGIETRLGSTVVRLEHDGERVLAAETLENGERNRYEADQFILSMPLPHAVRALDPPVSAEVLKAAGSLRFRDFLTVALILDEPDLFPDNWLYIHSPEVRLGRIQNFKNWSPEMVPDAGTTCLGLEYFVQEGDGLWTASDEELIALGRDECAQLGLIDPARVIDGTVVRIPKAYPIYDQHYQTTVDVLRRALDRFDNLQVIGRNGQHRYNNQDHSMLAGILAARNVAGEANDVWSVNVEADYHEESSPAGGSRTLPKPAIGARTAPQF